MPVENIVFIEQTTDWKTWDTPDKGLRMDSFNLNPGVEYVERRLTGSGRGLKNMWQGQKLVTGSLAMPAHYEYLGWFLKAALMHDVASVVQGATSAYKHGFFPKDDTMPLGMSVQLQRDTNDADNVLGLIIDRLQFSCAVNESLNLEADYIGYDEAPTGGTWDYDGTTSAPAFIASPTYFADTILPYRFQHGTLTFDGASTYDGVGNSYSIVGGNSYCIEFVEVAIENNLDAKVSIGNRVPCNVVGQDRAVSGRFDLDQSTVDGTFRNHYRDGTNATLFLEFDFGVEADTGFNYTLTIVVPKLVIAEGALPDLEGSQDRRMQTVDFTGLIDSNGVDFNVFLTDTQTAY